MLEDSSYPEGECDAMKEAYDDTFVRDYKDPNFGRIKDIGYAQELAKEEERVLSHSRDGLLAQPCIEMDLDEKIMSDMEMLANLIILRNEGDKYSKAKAELLSRKEGIELLQQLNRDAIHSIIDPNHKLKSKRQQSVERVKEFSDSRQTMRRQQNVVAERTTKRNGTYLPIKTPHCGPI